MINNRIGIFWINLSRRHFSICNSFSHYWSKPLDNLIITHRPRSNTTFTMAHLTLLDKNRCYIFLIVNGKPWIKLGVCFWRVKHYYTSKQEYSKHDTASTIQSHSCSFNVFSFSHFLVPLRCIYLTVRFARL